MRENKFLLLFLSFFFISFNSQSEIILLVKQIASLEKIVDMLNLAQKLKDQKDDQDTKAEDKSKINDGGNNQKLILLSLGKHISQAPIINGTNQLPKPPIAVGITKKKIIKKACTVTRTLYNW